MDAVKYIFLFLIGTTILNFSIAVGARVKTGNKKFNILIFNWISLILNFFAVAALSGSEKQIAFAYFFQVIPSFTSVKMLMDSRGIKNHLKYYVSFWLIMAAISAYLITATDVGFTTSLLPVTLGMTLIFFYPAWETLVISRKESNWIEKGMGFMFITAVVNHFNYAFFRLDPNAQWWGWSVSIAQYQCLSIFLPLLINHHRTEIERKNIEQALEKLSGKNQNINVAIDELYRNLEIQIIQKEELTRKLQTSNEYLEEEREMNEVLIKTVSHDLANPLTVINAYIDMMNSGRIGREEWETGLQKIKMNSNAALDMISRIRKAIVTRSEVELLSLHAVPIDRAVYKLIDSFETNLKKKNISIHYTNKAPFDSQVVAEENALIDHVFSNVLSNAIKFSPEGSQIEIIASEQGDGIKIDFIDKGAGIDQGRLNKRILHSTHGTEGEIGTGFGLMVLGYFLRKFGGYYQLTSPGKNQGTTMSIVLKKSQEPSHDAIIRGPTFSYSEISQ